MDVDTDLNAPAIIAPDARPAHASGASPADHPIAVVAAVPVPPVPVPPVPMAAPAEGSVPAGTVGTTGTRTEVGADGAALLPRVRAEVRLADNQVYAAAELIRRGLARRVVVANAAVDSALPDDWEILGTPIHLERLPDGRARVTAGRRSA